MITHTQVSLKSLETFLASELEINKKQLELFKNSNKHICDLLNEHVIKNEDESIKELTLIVCTPAELEMLKQGLGARKKLLRGKIRNKERKIESADFANVSETDWTDKEYKAAIKRRKVQLADTDMLKTRIENL